MDSRY